MNDTKAQQQRVLGRMLAQEIDLDALNGIHAAGGTKIGGEGGTGDGADTGGVTTGGGSDHMYDSVWNGAIGAA